MLPAREFQRIVEKTPLVSIDLIIENAKGEVLLGLRRNEPARGRWFVPGGRILKDETIAAAFARILKKEIGITSPFRAARFLGVYEHMYKTNALGARGFGTHYVVLAYKVKLRAGRLKADDQHDQLRWWTVADLRKSRAVHKLTRAYFKD